MMVEVTVRNTITITKFLELFIFASGVVILDLHFILVTSSASSQDEKRKQREEKRAARQKELEAKRAARKGGAMKLGSKMS